MIELVERLKYAKNAVSWLLDHENGLVDMHGLVYWAEEVTRVRKELKKLL
jgi:hypothetical protein